MEADLERASQACMEFGIAVDSPQLFFIRAIDLGGQPIKIPYKDDFVTVSTLLKNYWEITSCRTRFDKDPALRILQGQFKGEVAVGTMKLSCLGLNPRENCFQVLDSASLKEPNQIQTTLSRLLEEYEGQVLPVTLLLHGRKINYDLVMNDKVGKMKAKLTMEVPEFKSFTPDMIKLQHKGFFLPDDNILKQHTELRNDRELKVIIKKREGCFRGGSEVTLPNQKHTTMSQLRIGDEVMSYNMQRQQFQPDLVTHCQVISLNEATRITFTNGTFIDTTPNHLFLCEDKIFRRISADPFNQHGTISKGTRMLTINGTVDVGEIEGVRLDDYEDFYHASMAKNHNLMVGGVISHNMFINIKLPDGRKEKVQGSPTTSIQAVKEEIQLSTYVARHHQRIYFAGRQLRNDQSLCDNNIQKDAMLNFVVKKMDSFNYVHPDTKLLIKDHKQRAIKQLIQTDEAVTICEGHAQLDSISEVKNHPVKQYYVIEYKGEEVSLTVSMDCYLEASTGEVLHISDLYHKYEHKWPSLRGVGGDDVQIRKITHLKEDKPIKFYKVAFPSGDNFVAERTIIHTNVVNFLLMNAGKVHRRVTLGASPDTSFANLKHRLRQVIGVQALVLRFDGRVLSDEETVMDVELQSEQTIVINSDIHEAKGAMQMQGKVEEEGENKRLYLQLSATQKNIIQYRKYAEWTVEQIMKEVMPNYHSSYFFLFAEIILLPHEQLRKVAMSNHFNLADNTIIIVKNQKLSFIQNMQLNGNDVQNYSHILFEKPLTPSQIKFGKVRLNIQEYQHEVDQALARVAATNRPDRLKDEQFVLPFLYFSSGKFKEQIEQFILNFHQHVREGASDNPIFLLIKSLYINLNYLKNYIGQCFVGMRNFKFSWFFKRHQTFYWHSFTQARLKSDIVVKDLKGQRGTLFHIQSLTGKIIDEYSLYPNNRQVIFSPYTYFLVEKIKEGELMDEVWLSEMTSPVTFQKNIILWVDDNPKNNTNQIDRILAQKDIEILQVTSTVIAEKWVKEFGWLLNWKGLEFKLISDMAREEGVADEKSFNEFAGLDLLERLYSIHGITAHTLIFCGNAAKGNENAQKRKIDQRLYYQIGDKVKDLQAFCQIEKI